MPKLTLLSLSLTGTVLTLTLAGAALAGPAFRWTAADGSIAFSDDLKKIPSQYRASAQRVGTRNLVDYPRYTPAESGNTAALFERVERLRAMNAAEPAYAASGRVGQTDTILQLDHRTSVAIPNGRTAGAEPVVVEQRRVRDRNNISTTHVTVVRQGDEILSVVRPESAHDRADWGSESDLIGD